ncbi:MAG: L-threonylcarbamoyladenylate synthase, partial [bacterium]
ACREDPDRLGVRLLSGPLEGVAIPLFQTSANRSGAQSPSEFSEIEASILDEVDLAIDGGQLQGEASTVLDLTRLDSDGDWEILRSGPVGEAELKEKLS